MKKYLSPEFEFFEVDLLDVICNSPVEQYATEEVTNQPVIDPGEGGGLGDDF